MKLNFYRYRFPTALFLAISMALAPVMTEAANKKDDRSHKRSHSSRVEKRAAPAQRAASNRPRANVPRHVASSTRSRTPKPQAASRHHSSDNRKPQHVASSNRNRSHDKPTRQQAIANARAAQHKPDHHRNMTSSSPSTRAHIAENHRRDSAHDRKVVSRPRSIASAHRNHDDARARASRSAAIAAANRRADNHRGDDHRRHSRAEHRDRSNYTRRHDHHSHDWYVNNGWHYDRDYYAAHRVHRYYNDYNRTYIIEVNGPGYSYPVYSINNGYGYGYAEPAPAYRDYGSGYDYTTRVLVQQQLADAGYYSGAIDGDIGPGTRSAIVEYQYDAGLPTTGVIDEQLLDSLGIQ